MKIKYIVLSMGVVALSLKGSFAAEGGPSQVFKCQFPPHTFGSYEMKFEELIHVGKEIQIIDSSAEIITPQPAVHDLEKENIKVPSSASHIKGVTYEMEGNLKMIHKSSQASFPDHPPSADEVHAHNTLSGKQGGAGYKSFSLTTTASLHPDTQIKVKNTKVQGKNGEVYTSAPHTLKHEDLKKYSPPNSLEDIKYTIAGQAQVQDNKLYLKGVAVSVPNAPTTKLPDIVCNPQ